MDRLSDDLLGAAIALLPTGEAKLCDGALKLTTRGAPECVSRRWRRACLALPSHVRNLDVAKLEGRGESPAAALRSSVEGRNVVDVGLHVNPQFSGRPRAWQELADAVPGTVTRLSMFGVSALEDMRGVALLCRRLPALQSLSLDSYCDEEEAARPLEEALRASTALTHLDLNHVLLHTASGALEAVAALPRLRSIGLTFSAVPDDSWGLLRSLGSRLSAFRLELFAPFVDDVDEEPAPPEWPAQLLTLTECGEVELFLNSESAEEMGWPAKALAGIERLPTLRTVTTVGDVPRQVWACGQVTRLFMQKALLLVPGGPPVHQLQTARQVSSLQCLDMLWCSFWMGQFPPALCGLPALTSLQIYESGLSRTPALPPQVSDLKHLRQLIIGDSPLDAPSLQALQPLVAQHALRELQLPQCQLPLLPVGPWLSGLTSLNMGASLSDLRQHLPAVAAAATNLNALRLGIEAKPEAAPSVWEALQGVLGSLPNLEVLATPLFISPPTQARPFRQVDPKPSHAAAIQLRELAVAAGSAFSIDTSGRKWLPAQFSCRDSIFR